MASSRCTNCLRGAAECLGDRQLRTHSGLLPKEAFHVYEDGVVQNILSFRHEDLPVSLGILIDSSGSMIEKKSAVDAASINLVKLSNRADEAFLVDFNSEAYIDEDFTGDIGKLQQGLGLIHVGGGTALYDAVVASADYLSKNSKQPKQVLLLITDGDDNASSASLEQAIERVQDLDGPAIYCIGLLFGDDSDRRENRHAKEVLQELAEQTGGQAYFPESLREVSDITTEVAQDIRTQYTISYRSTKPPDPGRLSRRACGGEAEGPPRPPGTHADRLLPQGRVAPSAHWRCSGGARCDTLAHANSRCRQVA